MQVDFNILNQRGTPMFFQDTLANRPTAGTPGRLFVQTDSPYGIYRDTGSTWTQVASTTGGGGSQDLNGVMSIGTALLDNYDITPVNFDLRILNGVGDYVNFHARSEAVGTSIFGTYDIGGNNNGCYFVSNSTTLHGHYKTSGGAERTFMRFNRSTANVDFGCIDESSPAFIRVNHSSSNRNIATYYQNIKQGLEFDFDNTTAYFGNLSTANSNAILIECVLNPDDTTSGSLFTKSNGTTPYGFGMEVDVANTIRKSYLGDWQNNYNGASIVIDDNPISTIPEVRVTKRFANDSLSDKPIFNTPISTDPYTPNGDFWLIEIQGVQYGIELRTFFP